MGLSLPQFFSFIHKPSLAEERGLENAKNGLCSFWMVPIVLLSQSLQTILCKTFNLMEFLRMAYYSVPPVAFQPCSGRLCLNDFLFALF